MAGDPKWLVLLPACATLSSAHAEIYLGVTEAQQALLPGRELIAFDQTLNAAQIKAIEKHAGVKVRQPQLKAWRSSKGEWFLVDQVLGKHEFITWALALDTNSKVLGIEILEYRESYGHEVRNRNWRSQFSGKSVVDAVRIDQDIKNISGATLSSVHLTEGVRRLIATHALVLADH